MAVISEYPLHNTGQEVQTAIDSCTSVVKKIQGKDFSCRTNKEKVCRECDFRFYCGKD